ncbi:ABC transporter ATP-binding protein [Peribacillus kribbensis]|uniref:ABC transporter ATP-binding protein n=1 Tax=Peribacillus kribbensis TaxID=356658 RepID=UPI00047E8A5D|nr:ABC transporter ATP-binding protein [Peribacillus kribbensis]
MIKLFGFLKPFRGLITFVLALVMLQSLSELYLPTLMSDIVDKGVVAGNTTYIWKIGGWMLLVAAGGMICSISASFFTARISSGFGRSLRTKVFSHVSHFTQQEIDTLGTASLITRTTNDITQIQQVLVVLMRVMILAPMMSIGGIIMALSKDVKLTLVLAVSIPILVAAITLVARKGVPLFKVIQVKLDAINRILRENLTGIRVIRSFNRIQHERQRFDEASWSLTETSVRVNKIMAAMMPGMMVILNLSTVAIVWFGGIRISHGHMEIGDMMAFIQYAMQIMFSFIMLSMMFIMLPRAAVSAARINEVLEIQSVIKDGMRPADPDRETKGKIEFRGVSFRYPGAEMPALKNISFTMNPGEVTAVIGGTGSGKSTLLQLIPRFYDVESGSVLIDGVDVRDMKQEDLRKKIGLVPQQAVLFTGTISENIRYGREEAKEEEILHALRTAQAEEFISRMPEGLETAISQGGTNLSGGQKQRLSIARAVVRKPEVYLFDDSFSALDVKTDAAVRAALKEETTHSTVLIVAQRVSTIVDADQIIVLDHGEITGIGTHQELMADSPVYREIVMSQMSEEEIA